MLLSIHYHTSSFGKRYFEYISKKFQFSFILQSDYKISCVIVIPFEIFHKKIIVFNPF